ncbi:hypothetical protein [Geodermatophilus sp. DSM 44513]|uniref:hypothetical protein n=1 Tax=Geodermatophilus sp. DSM 44513 TaxID=1528104 RepID=UPI00141327CD|nr:hypothetical protein [Geodermatophilus sp. DSM 44513]WNV73729.1 hypothetical protein RTG05_12115 [Geodermatophilus sp. DSM 44513]
MDRAAAAAREWVVMGWAIVSVLGFALVTGVVIGLARSSTARWERDHRAARAAVREHEQAGLRARAAALVAQRVPHPHPAHLPHVHLPPWVAERVAHTWAALHRPHPRLPDLHLPHPHLPGLRLPRPTRWRRHTTTRDDERSTP